MNRGRHRKIIDVFYQALKQFDKLTNDPLLYHIRAEYKYSNYKTGSISCAFQQHGVKYTLTTLKNFIKKNVNNDSPVTLTLYNESTPISKITGTVQWKD